MALDEDLERRAGVRMIKQVLLPLDGSPLAGQITVHLERLLLAAESVKLLVVVDPGHPSPQPGKPETSDEGLRRRIRGAQVDLQRYEDQLTQAGVNVTGEVLVGDPAALILTQASLSEPSFVAMATHGLGGVERWLRGSVAERVLRRCAVPLLLVNARALSPPAAFELKRIVVPLDGSDRAAAILPLVTDLARVHDAEVVLMRVRLASTAPSDLGNPGWAVPVVLIDEASVRARVEALRGRLERAGVSARTLEITETSAAKGILEAVTAEQADLLALTSHGRSGLDKYVFGSVAEKVVRRCRIPLLVQRVPGRVPGTSGP